MENLVMDHNFWKDKTVLITGHTGFKGSWLSIWLQRLGAKLIGFSNNIPTQPSLFELAHVEHGMDSIIGDIRNFEDIENVIKKHKPEIVIHMAAQSLVRKSYGNPLETYSTNIMGTVNVLEAIRRVGEVHVVINVTSDKCYENKKSSRPHIEDDPMGGYDPYSCSKGCAELITSSFINSFFNIKEYQKHRIALASVRAGNVIGGGDWQEDRIIPDIMRSIMKDSPLMIRNPHALRPWQFVLDPLNGYLLLAEKLWNARTKFVGGWNFGPDSKNIKSVSWIVENILRQYGKKNWELDKNDHPHEADHLILDCSKAKTELGWFPKTNLEYALAAITEWYKNYERDGDIRRFTEKQIENFESI